MGLKESGLRGSLRNVSVGIDAIPEIGLDREYYVAAQNGFSDDDPITTVEASSGGVDLSGEATYRVEGVAANDAIEYQSNESHSADSLPLNDGYTAFVVFELRELSFAENRTQIVQNAGSNIGVQFTVRDDSDQLEIVHPGGGGSEQGGSVDTDPHIGVIRDDGNETKLRLDGSDVIITTELDSPTIDDNGTIAMGSGENDASPVNIAGFGIGNEDLDDSEVGDLEQELSDFYGISLS